MEFAEFAKRARTIEQTEADTETTTLVASLFQDAGDDLPTLARFVQGRVFPSWSSTTLDIGPSYCYEAIARAAGHNVQAADVEDRLAELGDVGAVAASFDLGGQTGLDAFGSEESASLTVGSVFSELQSLAAVEGEGSQGAKIDRLFSLFNRCSDDEARVLARLVLGEMRIGVGEGTVRDAIAKAFLDDAGSEGRDDGIATLDSFASSGTAATHEGKGGEGQQKASAPEATDDLPKSVPEAGESTTAIEAVERALQVSNDYGLVAERARDGGRGALAEIDLEIGRPVKAMLAQAGTVTDALEDWDEVAVEPKYDGARLQVHYDGEDVELYSRNMEAVTDPLPDVVEFVEAHCTPPAILDGEVVAVDDDGDPLPFQEVLRRFRRKHDVEATRADVAVEFHAFDCLYAPRTSEGDSNGRQADGDSGESLLDVPLAARHDRLDEILSAGVVDLTVTDDPDEIERIESEVLAAGHEGLMLKNPDAAYTPGSRGRDWLKRKPDVETLDLVVTGAEWGEGRRANLLGTYEVSAVDGAEFARLGNVATGLSDEDLEAMTERLEPLIRQEAGQSVDVDPSVVVEVGYEEIQRSPDNDSGYALRFPRFVGVRPDKDVEDADSIDRVARLA